MIDLDLKPTNENLTYYLEKDFINRNKYINSLGKLLLNLTTGAIISLDGSWGCGKTIFLKELEYLINNGYDNKFKNIEKQKYNRRFVNEKSNKMK